jgi:hypothetical protein
MCFVWISEETAAFALSNIKRLVFITEVESVYSMVRTESLYKTTCSVFKGLNKITISSDTNHKLYFEVKTAYVDGYYKTRTRNYEYESWHTAELK